MSIIDDEKTSNWFELLNQDDPLANLSPSWKVLTDCWTSCYDAYHDTYYDTISTSK